MVASIGKIISPTPDRLDATSAMDTRPATIRHVRRRTPVPAGRR